MRKAIQVLALALALSASTHAGDMQCGITGTAPPPPPPANGVMANGAQIALSLLQSVLALF